MHSICHLGHRLSPIILFLFTLCGMSPLSAFGQTDFWQRADGGFGEGNVTHLAIAPNGHMFAGTNFGIYRTTNDGGSWMHLTDGIVFSLAAHPNGDLYASSCSGECGLFRSTDDGNTWLPVDLGVPNVLVHALAIRVSGTVFAATNHDLYRSTDNGASWTPFTVASGDTTITALGLASGLLFAGLSDPSIPFGFGTLRRSTDDGATWSQFSPVWSLDPINGIVRNSIGYTFAATNAGVRRSTDFGATWTLTAGFAVPVNAIVVNSIGYLFAAAGDLLTSTSTGGGIFRSTNRGDTWVKMNKGLTIPNSYSVTVGAGGTVYAGGPFTRVFRSADTAATWSLANHSMYSDGVHALAALRSGTLLAGTNDGVFSTTDEGNTWFQQNTGLPGLAVYALHESENGLLYVGFNNPGAGVARSSDGGLTWSGSATGLGSHRVFTIASFPDGSILVGTETGIYRSTDNGDGWGVSGTGGPSNVVRALMRVPSVGSVVAGSGSGVYVSSDSGKSWNPRSLGLGGTVVLSLAASGSGDLFAGTDAGVFRSANDGGSWTAASSGLPNNTVVNALAFGGDGFLYAATGDSGAYRSSDNGGSWEAVNTGISNPALSSLVPGSSGRLFAGAVRVFGSGVTLHKTSQPTTSVQYAQQSVPKGFRLEQNYPNPFNPTTVVSYQLSEVSDVRLVVYDLLGREVAVLVNERLAPGSYTARFDGTGLASGVYFYRLAAGNLSATKRLLLMK